MITKENFDEKVAFTLDLLIAFEKMQKSFSSDILDP